MDSDNEGWLFLECPKCPNTRPFSLFLRCSIITFPLFLRCSIIVFSWFPRGSIAPLVQNTLSYTALSAPWKPYTSVP